MSTFGTSPLGESTSAAGAMLTLRQVREPVLVGVMLVGLAPSNEEHLHRVLSVLRKIDRGSSSANRTALLGVRKDGSIPFDLLVARDYEGVLAVLGRGEARRVSPPELSDEARAARVPGPPEELVGALQDRIHPTSGRLLGAKPIATTRRK